MIEINLNQYLNELTVLDERQVQGSPKNKELDSIITNLFSVIDELKFGDIFSVRFYDKLIFFHQYSFGSLDIRNLFNINELFILNYYFKSTHKNVIDIGANIGLHSIINAVNNKTVTSYEPDPIVFGELINNIKINNIRVDTKNIAISNQETKIRFNRVLNNLTASGIEGKKEYYGPKEIFEINTIDSKSLNIKNSLIKIDAEGSEGDIVCNFDLTSIDDTDFIIEVGNVENSIKIFNFFKNNSNHLIYSQKLLWGEVNSITEMPTSRHDGTIFVSKYRKFYD